MSLNKQDLHWVELHCHLEGSYRLETVIEEAKRHGETLWEQKTYQEAADFFTVTKPVASVLKFLDIFARSQFVLKNTEGIQRVSKELVIDKFCDNVRVLEVRYSPGYIQQWNQLPFEVIHQAVITGIQDGIKYCSNQIQVGLICIGETGVKPNQFREVVDFAIQHKHDFVGFDHAGPEVNLLPYKDCFDRIHQAGLHITIHAGEDCSTGKAENVLTAIEQLHAKRIGHGIQIVNHPDIIKKVVEKNILLEICPTSNLMTKSALNFESHPVRELINRGVKISINTDDPGIFNCTLSGEYQMLKSKMKFTDCQILKMNEWAKEFSFINAKSL